MAIYYVPAVWKNNQGVLTDVVVKLLNADDTLSRGRRVTVH